jgi:hypothetical protein
MKRLLSLLGRWPQLSVQRGVWEEADVLEPVVVWKQVVVWEQAGVWV